MTPDMLPETMPDTRTVANITVRHALGLPVLRRGMPQVLAGHDQLDRPIRWVHAGEIADIASVLIGGEMLLTTGMGIGTRKAEQRRYVERLAAQDIAALVIELGTTFPQLPTAVVDAARRTELPLVALRREIAFVSVTEAIHTEIVSSHYALLRRGEQIQRRLTGLMLDGEGIPEVLSALAATLRAPVFLEGQGGRLLSHALPPDFDLDPLDVWDAARTAVEPPGVQATAVRMGSHQAAGRLLVADLHRPFDALAAVALDYAADIVALALLRARQEEELVGRERGSFLANLADGRVAPEAVARTALAAGLDAAPERVLPVAADVRAGIAAAPGEWSMALRDVRQLLADRALAAIVGRRATSSSVLALVCLRDAEQRDGAADAAATALRTALQRRLGGTVTIAAGRATALEACGAELRLAEESAASAVGLPERSWHDVARLELRRLLWSRREDTELAAFVERVLGPLLEHDRQRKLVLLPTLQALLANGGRKAETARALHLNRQALYHRLTRIEQLLGADLSDADQLLTLHVALYARAYVDPSV